MNKKQFIIASFFIAVLSISLRLYKVTSPVADWHSWRQSDTAAVARNFVTSGIDLLHPRYDDLSNIQSGKDNPEGYRMVEFPLYQGIAAILFRIYPGFSIEIWLRLIAIAASTGTALLLGSMVFIYGRKWAAVFTMLTYAVLPYSVFYGRAILPDTIMVFCSVAGIFLLFLSGRVGKKMKKGMYMSVSFLAFAAAILVKPYAVFLLIPAVPFLFSGRPWLKKILIGGIFAAVVIGPFLLWRMWILQYPEGIPASEWLLNGNGIRFKGAWFEWLFAERLGKLILGYWGMIPFGLGLALLWGRKKEGLFISLLGGGTLLYLMVVASGNVQHDYYQILCIPFVSLVTGMSIASLVFPKSHGIGGVHPLAGRCLAFLSLGFACMFSWYTVRTYYWINRPEIVEAGQLADSMLPADAKVIAPYNGDTTFLYQTKRQGWPLGFDIEEKIAAGATHYVTVSPSDEDLETRDLARDYTVLVRTDTYAIIDLTKKKEGETGT